MNLKSTIEKQLRKRSIRSTMPKEFRKRPLRFSKRVIQKKIFRYKIKIFILKKSVNKKPTLDSDESGDDIYDDESPVKEKKKK